MKVTIHQPNFLPYLGFFEKILYSDVFVVYDTAQFSRDGFQQRNYIKLRDEKHLCTLAVGTASAWHLPIMSVPLIDNRKTQNLWKTITLAYRKTPYFDVYRNDIESFFFSNPTTLSGLSMQLIEYFLQKLNWKGKIVYASSIGLDPMKRKTDALLEIVQKVGGTVYVSGSSGKSYLEEDKFRDAGIDVVYQSYTPLVYPQMGDRFIPGLAFLDYLFNAPLEDLQFKYKFDRKERLCVMTTAEEPVAPSLVSEKGEE